MNYVIYGAGYRGKRLLNYIGEKKVCAFIDVDTEKQGKPYCGVPVISLDEYLKKYESCFIIITPAYVNGIEEMLNRRNIYQYSNLSDMPSGSCDTHNYRRHILLCELCGKPGQCDRGNSCQGRV